MTTWYLFVPGSFEPLALEQEGRAYFYHLDGLGTPLALTDAEGRQAVRYDYAAFGARRRHGGRVRQALVFPGQYLDEETGLHYNWHRYYDPAAGRYLTPDPLGLAGGINRYPYVENNPINFVDPSGLLVLYASAGGAAGGDVGRDVGSSPTYFSKGSGVYFGLSDEGGSASGIFSSNGAGGAAGGGIGLGGTIGFSTGTTQDFNGSGTTTSLLLGPISLSFSSGNGNWGVSLSGGGKGWGLGVAVEESQISNIQLWQSDYGRNDCK
nr:RHS repeat-associated core domain-containing protein [Dissulfurirhabdus thermomarina]